MAHASVLMCVALLAFAGGAWACTHKPGLPKYVDAQGNAQRRYSAQDFAFEAEVVGHKVSKADRSLLLRVTDAFTERVIVGDAVEVSVRQWRGCLFHSVPEPSFDPREYGLSTRVRITAPSTKAYPSIRLDQWDMPGGIQPTAGTGHASLAAPGTDPDADELVAATQRALVDAMDPSLPSAPLEAWLRELLSDATPSWSLSDCDLKGELESGGPLCVQVSLRPSGGVGARLQFLVGTREGTRLPTPVYQSQSMVWRICDRCKPSSLDCFAYARTLSQLRDEIARLRAHCG